MTGAGYNGITIYPAPVYEILDAAVMSGRYGVISEQGGSRSGKTYNTMLWLTMRALSVPGMTISVCRATFPALKGSVMRDFEDILTTYGLWGYVSENKSDHIFTFSNGSWIEFFSVDDEQKLRGRKRRILFLNEGNDITFMEWQQLLLRTTELAIVDYNPSFSEEHWIAALNREAGTYHFITTYDDNPFLEPRVIATIEGLKDKSPSLYKIYREGRQAEVEGLVFRKIEVIDEIPQEVREGARRYRGLDFGFTNDPTAGVDVYLPRWEQTVCYLDELFYRTGMLTSDIIAELRDERDVKTISESADPRLVQEIYRAGINVHPVRKYKGSIEAGVAKMQEYTFRITRRSYNLLKEWRNYVWAKDKEGRQMSVPIDAYNHGIDATRYVFLSEVLGRGDGGRGKFGIA